jgi:hypothetical protein
MLVSVVDVRACSPTSPLHYDHSPEAMTRRARWYLSVAGLRQGTLGLFCILTPWLFTSAAFIPILSYLPVAWWGIFMTICGILCGLAALLRSGDMARVAMVISATITLVLAAGVWIGIGAIWVDYWQGDREVAASPLMPILLTALAAKDYIVCAQPVRSPFEAVVRQVMGE